MADLETISKRCSFSLFILFEQSPNSIAYNKQMVGIQITDYISSFCGGISTNSNLISKI